MINLCCSYRVYAIPRCRGFGVAANHIALAERVDSSRLRIAHGTIVSGLWAAPDVAEIVGVSRVRCAEGFDTWHRKAERSPA